MMTLPMARRSPTVRIAPAACSKSNRCPMCGTIIPARYQSKSWRKSSLFETGSTIADAPYATPTIEIDFRIVWLALMIGISPPAKPTRDHTRRKRAGTDERENAVTNRHSVDRLTDFDDDA